MLPPDISPSMDEVIAHSFADYHVKGFDYLCVRRSPARTVKLYFFDGDVADLPEVVNPHDHRYDFRTTCLAGTVTNRRFLCSDAKTKGAKPYQTFAYRTLLNGGDGFRWLGESWLTEGLPLVCESGESYWMRSEHLHTIRIHSTETILMLEQLQDVVPIGKPTLTFTQNREPPALSGLYNRMTADRVLLRRRQLFERSGLWFEVL